MEETEVPPTQFTSKYMNEAKFRNLREQRKLDKKILKLEDEKETKAGKLGMQKRFLNLELKEMRHRGPHICPMGLSAEQRDAYKTLQNNHLPSISLEEFDKRLTSFRLERETTKKWKQKMVERARNARMHQFRKVQNQQPSNESEPKKPTPLLANIITKLQDMKNKKEEVLSDDEHDQDPHNHETFDFDIKMNVSRSAPTSPGRNISLSKARFQFSRAATVFGVSLTDTPRRRTRPLKNNSGKFGMAVTQSNVLDLTPQPKEKNFVQVFQHEGKCVSLPDLVSKVTHIVHAWNAFKVPLRKPVEMSPETDAEQDGPALMEPPLPGSTWKNFNVFNRTLKSLADAEIKKDELGEK